MKKHGKKAKRRRQRKPKTERREVQLDELKAILERAKAGVLTDDDHQMLTDAVDTLAHLTRELEAKGASIKRLRNLIFGARTEKTSQVVGSPAPQPDNDAQGDEGGEQAAGNDAGVATAGSNGGADGTAKPRKKRKGHGRKGAAEYTGAQKVNVPHDSLGHGDPCPECDYGRVYRQTRPKRLVRVRGMAPLAATVYELERLRCGTCGTLFTAQAPDDVGDEKYDETAAAMLGLLKYGTGVPFNRLEGLENSLGIPLPASTQWEVLDEAATLLTPAYSELVRRAAQGKVLYNDDTTMKILELDREAAGCEDEERTGVFTSGIVAGGDGHQIALFFTGWKHAGENLSDVLAERAQQLAAPIQMCDTLSRNTAGDNIDTVLAACLAHGRRKFVDVADSFPDEVRHVLEVLRDVYHNDKVAREQGMSDEQRLRYHQEHSAGLMTGLETWFKEQFRQRKVEPNSVLGEAIQHMQKHWKKFTLFLRKAGAPLDNNLCERSLKRVILHRKNALFYKTENGARVGDLFMSLIHTAELCQANPYDYLVALLQHAEVVDDEPHKWMPWNYTETLAPAGARP